MKVTKMSRANELLRRKDPTDKLLGAAANYIEAKGGKALVIGGIAIMQEPTDGEHRFSVVIRCTGRKPAFAEESREPHD